MKDSKIIDSIETAIRSRWPTADDFYRERDDRTARSTPHLAEHATHPVEIIVDPANAISETTQRIALVACSLTARWARNIRVVLPHNVAIANGLDRKRFKSLEGRIRFEMHGADPFGNFEFVSTEDYELREDANPKRLFVGECQELPDPIRISDEDLLVAADGEYVIVRRGEPLRSPLSGTDFTPSAALGAALGAADLFKRAIGHERTHWMPSLNWNLIDHSTPRELAAPRIGKTERINIGNVLVAGVGAIGSSLVYLLDLAAVEGEVALLDRDHVETSNLNRSLLFDVWHVLAGSRKTELAESYLQETSIKATRLDGPWREQALAASNGCFDVWLSFTNEDGAWAQLPFQLPPVVIQGTTTSGWGFGAGRHIPRKEDCTLCRMPRPEAEFRGPCAEGEIAKLEAEPSVRAALPFLSAASAALVLAELFKLGLREVDRLPNDISADLRYGLPSVVAVSRKADENCKGCRIVNSELWLERGGRGRYRALSE